MDSIYNNGQPINLNELTEEEREQALKEFAEGSTFLETTLKVSWKAGLPTKACCKGDHVTKDGQSINTEAYISFDKEVDAFAYLSRELLEDDFVELQENEYGKSIRFHGESKESLILHFALDVLLGKKDNSELLYEKINKHLDDEIYIEALMGTYKNLGMNYEDSRLLTYTKYISLKYFAAGTKLLAFCQNDNMARQYIKETNEVGYFSRQLTMSMIEKYNLKPVNLEDTNNGKTLKI